MSNLRSVVEIFLALNRAHARLCDGVDPVYPLAAPRADVSRNHKAQRGPVRFGKRLPVHLPREEDFLVLSDFAPRHGDGVVVHVVLPVFPPYRLVPHAIVTATHLKYVSTPMNSTCWHSGRIPPHAIFRTFFKGTPRYTAVPLETQSRCQRGVTV